MAAPPGPPAGPPSDEGLAVGGARYPAGPPPAWPEWSPAPFPPGPPEAGPGPPPGGGGGRGWNTGLLVALAVVAVLVVAGIIAFATSGSDGIDLLADDPAGTTAPAPPGPAPLAPEPEPVPPTLPGFDPGTFGDPEELARPLDEVLPEIIAFVEQQRGHTFRTPPVVEALPEAEFVEWLRTLLDDTDVGAGDLALRALGAVPDDVDSAQADLLEEGVKGVYRPETGVMTVRGDVITPLVQSVLAHELTHALDDQHFDLGRLEALGDEDGEEAFGLQALSEGSARVVEIAFIRDRLDADEQAAVLVERLGLTGGGGLPDVTDPAADDLVALALRTQVPYGNGEILVEALLADGGTAAVDAAFRDPPTTSEQVLDPSLYRAREAPVPTPAPAADGDEARRGAFGAVDLRFLEAIADPVAVVSRMDPMALVEGGVAFDPLDGFGGGRYVTWEGADGEACLRANLAGDDPAGTATMRELVDDWAAAVGEVDVSSTGPTTFSFTTCR